MNRFKTTIAAVLACAALAACGPNPSYPQAYAQPPAFDASGVPLQQQMAAPQDRGFLSEHGDALLGAGAGYLLGRSSANNRSNTTTIIQQPGYTTVAPAQRYYGKPYTGYSQGTRPSSSYSSSSTSRRGVTSTFSRSSSGTSRSFSSSRR